MSRTPEGPTPSPEPTVTGELPQQKFGPVLSALMFSWGYDYQSPLARARENDQIVRRLATAALAAANDKLRAIEVDYRRLNVPPPTRQKPFAPQEVQDALVELHRLSRVVTGFIGTIESMESAPADHQAKRLGLDADWSTKCIAADIELVLGAQRLRDAVIAVDASTFVISNLAAMLKPLLDDLARHTSARRDLIARSG